MGEVGGHRTRNGDRDRNRRDDGRAGRTSGPRARAVRPPERRRRGRLGFVMVLAATVAAATAVLVQPSGNAGHALRHADGDVSTQVNGLTAQVDRGTGPRHELDATFSGPGVDVTITMAKDLSSAQQILGSFRSVAP